MLSAGKVVGQSTVPGNAGIATDFLGWDNTGTNNFPLMVRHDLNQPIEWYTDAVLRMRLAPTLTNQNWAWWQTGTLDFSGHLGLGSTTPASPLTYLHINQGGLGAISVGYRPWMRTGVFTSESSDAMYVGLHRSTNNQANAVINWSDDLGGTNPDALRFIFTTVPDSSSVAATYRGLELARLIPAGSGDEGFFGVGDFFSPALQPTERVDILDGRLRIRQLPDDSAAVDSFYVMVVDRTALTTNNQERGVVKWVAPDALGGSDCDWVVQSPEPHVSSVYTGTNCPWSEKHGVGMGVQIPKMKLQVFHTDNSLLNRIAIWGSSRFMVEDGQEVQGIIGEARPPAQDVSNMNAFGVMGVAEGSKFCTGVEGRGLMDQYTSGTAASVIGVSGSAVARTNSNVRIGV